ncbi:MAG TPA: Shedu immune nuclease family protein [Longimicrobium sp.]|jgi:hypothetical protein|uniref:Shedu immune nuclease family protein n=1 Tax=Longimicrobium sp. TaxID=2029185 RepID=UPI002ED8384B
MKSLNAVRFDPVLCREELQSLAALLATPEPLGERRSLLPFFRRSLQLSALIGSYSPQIGTSDLVAHEYVLFGDFTCDLVVGDSRRQSYCFIEFEDAAAGSIFVQRGRATPSWSRRLEHGFSQLIDWFWKLDDARGSAEYQHRFGGGYPRVMGIIVVGRDGLASRERQRLQWRSERVVVDSKQIICLTYDQLLADLTLRLDTLADPR